MKRLVALVFALICLAACQKAPELTLTGSANVEVSADGGSSSITFTANRDWSASCSDSWIHISPSSGSAADGQITVSIRCDANTTYSDRSGTVTIKAEDLSQTITVKQPANLGVIVATKEYNLTSEAKTIEVEFEANVQYSVSVSESWIKHTGTKALTKSTLVFTIAENTTYDNRSATITIKPQNSSVAEQVISVKQAQKDALIVKDTSFNMPCGGGEVEVKVEANVSFDVNPDVDWIHFVQTKALSNSTVCLTVDENKTYGPRTGTVKIVQKKGTLSHTITVKEAGRIAVTSITLDQTSIKLREGESATFVATIKPSNATDQAITWRSSNEAIAVVDANGTVTAIKEGTATITANVGEKTATCEVTVKKDVPVSSIMLDKTELTLSVGDQETLVATVKPDNATEKTVTWASSNEDVASVDENGKVTAISIGNVIISAKAGNITAECNVTICVAVSSIKLDKGELTLYEGEEYTLTATVYPDNATDKTVIWRSSDYTIAGVDWYGKVSALKGGVVIITAKAGDKTAECRVTVRTPVSSISLDKTELTLKPNESYSLVANISPVNASDKTVVWSSSDSQVVSVDNTGKVTALKEGTANISAEAGGKKATCAVTVLWAPEGAVNLGIVMTRKDGTKYNLYWAECNIGASVPEENGSLFAWGEVEEKIRGADYKYFDGSVAFHTVSILKYNTRSEYGRIDNKTVLEPEDDAAHVLLGGGWRMPTLAEIQALKDQCTWTWTTLNGKQGFKVKSKICSNSIFLPAAGGIIDNPTGMGIFGFYWSSTLYPDPIAAYAFIFRQGGVDIVTGGRYEGLSVRPVTE